MNFICGCVLALGSTILVLTCNRPSSVCLPIDNFECVKSANPKNKLEDFSLTDKQYTLLHYDGPKKCSTCILKFYYKWDLVRDYIGEENFQILLILEPQKQYSTSILADALKENYCEQMVVIDRDGNLRKNNPFIRKNANMDILINSEGEIIAITNIMKKGDKDICKINDIVNDNAAKK